MGEAKRKKIAQLAHEYANECGISFELAMRRQKLLNYAQIQYRRASCCPECGRHELYIESSDSLYSNESWVSCSECGFTHDITKKYEALSSFYAFDVVYAMREDREQQFGEDWHDFVLKDTEDMAKEYGIFL